MKQELKLMHDIDCNPNQCLWPNCVCQHEPVEIAPQFMSNKAVIISFVLSLIVLILTLLFTLDVI